MASTLNLPIYAQNGDAIKSTESLESISDMNPSLSLKLKDLIHRNLGLLLVIGSQLFVALMNLTVKVLSGLAHPVPTFELITVRMGITCVCCLVYMCIAKVPNPVLGPPEVRGWLVLRGVSGFFGLFGIYYSLQFLSLSDATAINFLAPTTTAILGFLLLRESVRIQDIVAGLCALFGVLLIGRPESIFGRTGNEPAVEKGTPTQRLIAVAVGLLGVFGSTGAMLTIRHIGARAHTMHSITYYAAWSVLVACVGSYTLSVQWVLPKEWLWSLGLLFTGIFGFAGQVLLTMGLQRETASRGSMGLYSQIIYSTVFERLVLHNTPGVLSAIGICIIVVSALYIALTKQSGTPASSSSSKVAPVAGLFDVEAGVSSVGNPDSNGYVAIPEEARGGGTAEWAEGSGSSR